MNALSAQNLGAAWTHICSGLALKPTRPVTTYMYYDAVKRLTTEKNTTYSFFNNTVYVNTASKAHKHILTTREVLRTCLLYFLLNTLYPVMSHLCIWSCERHRLKRPSLTGLITQNVIHCNETHLITKINYTKRWCLYRIWKYGYLLEDISPD